MFLLPKGPPVNLNLVTQGPFFGFICFCHLMVPPCVWKFFVTQGSPLWFPMFLSPKGPPLGFNMFLSHKGLPFGLTCFCHPRVPSLVRKFFVTQGSPLWFLMFCHPMVLPWVWKFFVTQGSPFGFSCCHQRVPPLVSHVFCHPRVPP